MPDNGEPITLYDYLKKYAPEFLEQLTPGAIERLKGETARIGSNILMRLRGSGGGAGAIHVPGVGDRVVISPEQAENPDVWRHEAMHVLSPINTPLREAAAWHFTPEDRREELREHYGAQNILQQVGFSLHAGQELLPNALEMAGWDPSQLGEYEQGFLGDIYKPEVLNPPQQQLQPTSLGGMGITPTPILAPTPTSKRKTQRRLIQRAPKPTVASQQPPKPGKLFRPGRSIQKSRRR